MISNNLLEIIKQPNKKFFKDEGGKKKYLFVEIKYNGEKNLNIPLVASLYYENKNYAVGQQEILKMKDNLDNNFSLNKKFLFNTSENIIKSIYFRIDKVSRRLDNKNLRVKFEIDRTHEHFNSFKNINSIYTDPIEILSKRKIPAHLRNYPELAKEINKKRKTNACNSNFKNDFKKDLKKEIINELNDEIINQLEESRFKFIKSSLMNINKELKLSNKLLKEIKKKFIEKKIKDSILSKEKNFSEPIIVNNFYRDNFIDTQLIDKSNNQYNFKPCGYFSSDDEQTQYDYNNNYNKSFVDVNDVNPFFSMADNLFNSYNN